jgi:GNAT superfamily N-acetyltransferase
MNIRSASIDDFTELYEIGKSAPELRVSATEEFMDADEFRWSITNQNGVFLVAEEQKRKIGFLYASAKDIEKPFEHKYACLVYLVIIPEFRRQGVAQKLYAEGEKRLRELGVTNIYGWASAEGNGEIIEFMKKQGFAQGHAYVWMDKKIS